jgi:hypothetical protein
MATIKSRLRSGQIGNLGAQNQRQLWNIKKWWKNIPQFNSLPATKVNAVSKHTGDPVGHGSVICPPKRTATR